ncbi:MAG: PorT family protein [Fibrobacter sp.]|nr:PorT family protein [Fibrobacter sp.]
MLKKILMAAMVLASFTFAETFGVHAGANMSSLYGDGDAAEYSTNGFGFNAGLTGKLAFKDLPISFIAEAEIDMRNSGNSERKDFSMTEWALDIPVLVRFDFLGFLFVEAGPSFNFNLSTSTTDKVAGKEVTTKWNGEKLNPETNTFEFGLAFGVGTSIIPSVDIDFRVNLGLTNVRADETALGKTVEFDAKNLQFALGLSFWIM